MKYKVYSDKLKFCKNKIVFLSQKYSPLIQAVSRIFIILAISLCSTITAKSQSDTLSKKQLDSLVSWVAMINTDLHDYDLVKEKVYLQALKIKGLESITQRQEQTNIRKGLQVNNYSTQNILLQNQNSTLINSLKQSKKKALRRGIEVWAWRGGLVLSLFYLFIK